MNKQVILIILGMALVTYIPRALPAMFISKMKMSRGVEKFLRLIPYTAMAALIYPGILATDSANVWIGIAGGLTAFILSWKQLPVMVSVLGAMAVDMVIYLMI